MRLLRQIASVLLALVLLFEEWGWEPLQRLLARLARWRGFAWIEERIRALPPYAALVVMVVPAALLAPSKIVALAWIAAGHVLAGAALVVGAKIVGTALVARLFVLTKPALLTLPWFAALYTRWTAWKEGVFARVRASWVWRAGRVIGRRARRLAERLGRRLRTSVGS
jgi:hypothetical protein